MAQIMDGVSLPIGIEGCEDKSWNVWRLLFGDFGRGDGDEACDSDMMRGQEDERVTRE